MKNATHFVGFRGNEYVRAQMVFGVPDFVHHDWDRRAEQEVAPGDRVVFANKAREDRIYKFTYDDSARF